MKELTLPTSTSVFERHKARTVEWGRLISITGSAQVIVQALGFLSGLLVIRTLSSQQYALYTIAYTALGTMTVLTDGGIGAGVIAQGAKVSQDRAKLGGVLAAGLHLRKRFAIASILVAAPVLFFLLRHHGASWGTSLLLFACLIPAFLAALSDSLLELPPKLRQDIVPLQRNQVGAAIARMLLTVVSVLTIPLAFAAILAAGISRGWANLRLRKISAGYADWQQPPDRTAEKEILKIVHRSLPTAIYYCLSGQITIWLISLFSSTRAVGDVGALSGLSTAMNMFNVIFGTLVVPRFARLPKQRSILVKRFLFTQAGLIILGFLITSGSWLFAKEILWVLGKHFAGLRKELVLVAAGSCVAFIAASTNQLLSARGIIVPPLIFIGTALAAQVGLAFAIPLGTVTGILIYGIFTPLATYLIRIAYFGWVLPKNETPA